MSLLHNKQPQISLCTEQRQQLYEATHIPFQSQPPKYTAKEQKTQRPLPCQHLTQQATNAAQSPIQWHVMLIVEFGHLQHKD